MYTYKKKVNRSSYWYGETLAKDKTGQRVRE